MKSNRLLTSAEIGPLAVPLAVQRPRPMARLREVCGLIRLPPAPATLRPRPGNRCASATINERPHDLIGRKWGFSKARHLQPRKARTYHQGNAKIA